MNVEQLMTKDLRTCSPHDTLDGAARIMWENDCGVVPIVDGAGRVAGMITDRDICMAALMQNRLLHEIRISSVAMKPVVTVQPHDSAQAAGKKMQHHQVRRLAVTDDRGHLVGVLSLNDLARGAGRYPRDLPNDDIVGTLAAVSQPRSRGGNVATA